MLSPRRDETEYRECPDLKALKSRPLHQFASQLCEPVTRLELAEFGACQRAQRHVSATRCFTVTLLETQADSPANSH
jgi:hypothetical protein